MRIIFTLLKYPPLRRIGAELYDHALLKALQAAGHEVEVHAFEDCEDQQWEYDGVKVNPEYSGTYDLILTHVDNRQKAWYVARTIDQRDIPIVGVMHNNGRNTLMDEQLYNWHGVIYNSEYTKSLSTARQRPTQVLIPALDPTPAKLSKGTSITQINLTREKGVQRFYELVEQNPNQKFIGVEGGWGKQLYPTKQYDNLTILPHQADLTDVWLQTKQLAVLSETIESWTMAAAEAARHGIPTIVYNDLPGVIENVGPGAIPVVRGEHIELTGRKPTMKVQKHQQSQATLHLKQLDETVDFLERIMNK